MKRFFSSYLKTFIFEIDQKVCEMCYLKLFVFLYGRVIIPPDRIRIPPGMEGWRAGIFVLMVVHLIWVELWCDVSTKELCWVYIFIKLLSVHFYVINESAVFKGRPQLVRKETLYFINFKWINCTELVFLRNFWFLSNSLLTINNLQWNAKENDLLTFIWQSKEHK